MTQHSALSLHYYTNQNAHIHAANSCVQNKRQRQITETTQEEKKPKTKKKYGKQQEKHSKHFDKKFPQEMAKKAILIEISLRTGELLFCLYFAGEKVFDRNPHKYMEIVSTVQVASREKNEQFSIRASQQLYEFGHNSLSAE